METSGCVEAVLAHRLNDSYPFSFTRSTYYFSLPVHTVMSCIFMLGVFVSFIGNGLVWLTVPFRSGALSPFDIMLLNLCLAHLISSITLVPFVFILDVGKIALDQHADVVCVFTEALQLYLLSSGVSLIMLAAISYNRFVAILFPLNRKLQLTRRGALCWNAFAWVIIAVTVFPSAISFKYYPEIKICLRYWERLHINVFLYRLLLSILGTAIPLVWTLLSYAAILKKLLEENKLNEAYTANARNTQLRKAARVLGFLIISYLVFWTPFLTYWLVYTLTNTFDGSCKAKENAMRWNRVAVLICSINCAVDPFIYIVGGSILKSKVKRRLLDLFRVFRSQKREVQDARKQSSSTTVGPLDEDVHTESINSMNNSVTLATIVSDSGPRDTHF